MRATVWALATIAIVATSTPSQAALPEGSAVQQWNKIAEDTVLSAGAIQNEGLLYMAYESAAVYDAVVAIEGRYQPYATRIQHMPGASIDAAVTEAAYRVLRFFLPSQAVTLDQNYSDALATLTPGSAMDDGREIGKAAARAIIALRRRDGRLPIGTTSTVENPICDPGGYRRTPDGSWSLGPQTPWLGEVRPFLLRRAAQFQPRRPPRLSGRRWVEQLDEVKRLGSSTSTERTAEQTATARFWVANVLRQYNLLGRDLVTRRDLSLLDSARLLAMINVVGADAQIVLWHWKYTFQFWRPVTAIDPSSVVADWCDTVPGYDDGNDQTIEEAGWRPLLATPNHPEYPGAHGNITSAMAEVLSEFFGTDQIDVTIHGSADGTATNLSATRHYATAADLREEIMNARLWGGLHYRNSTEAGVTLGAKVAHYALAHGFKRRHY
jgi:hypothetical protein